jgi:hypothetical protein
MLRFVSGPCAPLVDVAAFSFTAGTDDRLHAATMTGFGGGSADTLRDIVASNGPTMLEPDDEDGAVGSGGSTTGGALVVMVNAAPKHAAPRWSVIDGIGVFIGSFIINCNGSGRRRRLRID